MLKTFTVNLEQDENGDCILPLPIEICVEMGWKLGDIITCEYLNGQITLKKKEE